MHAILRNSFAFDDIARRFHKSRNLIRISFVFYFCCVLLFSRESSVLVCDACVA